MNVHTAPNIPLIAVKLTHTAIWCFFVGCICAIPIAALLLQFKTACVLIGTVLVECAVLGLNRGRCPLTDIASRFTDERADNFDIYLPLWLAKYNKTIFGWLFVAGSLFVLVRWLAIR